MKSLAKLLLAIVAAGTLCSCAFIKAVSLPEAKGKPGGTVALAGGILARSLK